MACAIPNLSLTAQTVRGTGSSYHTLSVLAIPAARKNPVYCKCHTGQYEGEAVHWIHQANFSLPDCSIGDSDNLGPYSFLSSLSHYDSVLICVAADVAGLESMNN